MAAAARGRGCSATTIIGQGKQAFALADAFCEQARIRTDELFGRLWTNTDDTDKGGRAPVLDGDFTWLEAGVIDQSEGTGPWIAAAGPSEHETVHRTYR